MKEYLVEKILASKKKKEKNIIKYFGKVSQKKMQLGSLKKI